MKKMWVEAKPPSHEKLPEKTFHPRPWITGLGILNCPFIESMVCFNLQAGF